MSITAASKTSHRFTKVARSMGRRPRISDPSTYRGRFAGRLRELRVKRYETQDAFVAALHKKGVDVTKATVSGWEIGIRFPDPNSLPGIAAALGVSPQLLFPPG
ncbi:MAG TPA: helix-turn-helix domain-containing protein [Planctomycetaceae bacterium]|nr:helix-turn-helix domain-containing protein [Planctomycetaceae bacterium]